MSFKEGVKDSPIPFLLIRQWKFSEGFRGKIILVWIMLFISNLFDLFRPLIIAYVLNNIQTNGLNENNIYQVLFSLLIFVFLALAFWAFHGPARVMERKNAFLIRANFKKYMLDGTMNLNASWHTDHHSGDTIDKIEKGSQALYDFCSRNFEVMAALVKFIFAYVTLVYFNVHSAYILLVMVIITVTIILQFDKHLVKQYKVIFGIENKISAKVYDVISNITTVIILRIEKLLSKEMWKKIMSPFKIYQSNIKINETKWFLVSFMSSIMMVLVMGSYIYFGYKTGNVVMLGTIFILFSYVEKIVAIFYQFAWRYNDIVYQRVKVLNSEEVSNEFIEVRKNARSLLNHKWKELRIENLNFSYDLDGKNLHLNNLNLVIKKKQRIALVGASGSGKTTTLKLIRELYHINSGKIYLDGKELKNGFNEISSNIALIPQEPEIFATTIKENITVGVNYNMKEIIYFSKMARFNEVAQRLPKKYDSSIVEKGVNLSGGEKQRLALVRGLIASKDKEIILFDEPTSSVDSKNELEIYENIFKKFKQKTILSSVHRLHLLTLFDKIYYFKGGKVVAEGTFTEMIKECVEFRKLWQKYVRTHKD